MEKHQAFLSMMAHWKEELKKAGQGISSPKGDASTGPLSQVNPSLKTSAKQPTTTVGIGIILEIAPPGSGSKRKASRKKSVSSNKKSKKKVVEGPFCSGPFDTKVL